MMPMPNLRSKARKCSGGNAAEAVKHYQKAWKGLEPNAEYRRLVAVKLAALGADPEEPPTQESKK